MIKRFLFPLVALALAACTPTTVAGNLASAGAIAADAANVPAPVVFANKLILDERVGIAVELTYVAWRTGLEFAIDGGFIKTAATASRLKELDRKAYAATVATQRAYKTGNAASYNAARKEAEKLIGEAVAALQGVK